MFVGVFELATDDDVVARLPGQRRGDDVETFGDVLGDGDLARPRVDQPGETLARALDGGEHGVLVHPAHQHAVEAGNDRRMCRARQQTACRGVEIGTTAGAWKLTGYIHLDRHGCSQRAKGGQAG